MLNDVVSTGNTMVGRMISGLLALSLDHPFLLCAIMAVLAGTSCVVLLEMVGVRFAAQQPVRERQDRPVRLQRS